MTPLLRIAREEFYTILRADWIYLHAARAALERARRAWLLVDAALDRMTELMEREAEILQRYDSNTHDAYDELEPVLIQMVDNEQPEMEDVYGAAVAELALVHILCAAAVEAHVNVRAQTLLPSTEFEIFDQLNLAGKWMLLPRLLGRRSFDAGSEPYQSFAKLVRLRNALVHHKGRREPFEIGKAAPLTMQKLGLDLDTAERSIATVTAMIERLAELLGENKTETNWTTTRFFQFDIECFGPDGQPMKKSAM